MSESAEAALSFWNKAAEYIRRFSESAYRNMFAGIVPLSLEDGTIVLGVSDDFFAEWLVKNYGSLLDEALESAFGHKTAYRLEPGHEAKALPPEKPKTTAVPAVSPAETAAPAPSVPAPADTERTTRLPAENCLSKNTFDSFVVGEENRYSFYCAQAVARKTGMYNPLYIFGGTGLGKTHLMQAVANDVKYRNPSAIIRYVPCETFLNAFVEASINKTHMEFRDYYRKADFLLVDDVHVLGGKSALQDEFFNTFNSIYSRGGQIILTSDKQPGEIKGLEARLVSRFQLGAVTQITAPSFETRLAILRLKQKTQAVKFPDWLLEFIAERVTSHIRALEGTLLRVVSYCAAMNCSPEVLTTALTETLLADILDSETSAGRIDIDRILQTVADHYTLHVHDLVGSRRPKNIAVPRMVAMYLCRNMTRLSLKEIGDAFGGRNHTTVIHAVKEVEKSLTKDEMLQRNLAMLKRKIEAGVR